ncbi:MAG: CYTH domain-containing protein [Opitutaceae bacterium]
MRAKILRMGRHLEIERKFLVARPPIGWRRRGSSPIVQSYFFPAARNVEIRLRRIAAQHVITIKSGDGLRRSEVEIKITPAQFHALWPLTRAARIAQRRYRIPCSGHTIELDVYQGPHRGLITADIEFTSVRASRAFQPPPWLGWEITGQRRYGNAVLARQQRLAANLPRV